MTEAWWLEPCDIRIAVPACGAKLKGVTSNGNHFNLTCILPQLHERKHQDRRGYMFTTEGD